MKSRPTSAARGAAPASLASGPGVDEPLVWYEGASTGYPQWLHADRQGSIVAWSSAGGYVAADRIYKYGPWGEPDDGFAAGKSRFRYTGQIMLPEARLYYYKARVYDPISGRFLQTDPIGYKDDLNLYAYVGGDPVNLADPTGTQQCPTCDDRAGVAGELSGALADEFGSPDNMVGQIGHAFKEATEIVGPTLLGLAIGEIDGPEPGPADALGLAVARTMLPRVALEGGDAAVQSMLPAALAARQEVQSGATVYRIGTSGTSKAGEAQFWALEHPSTPGFAQRYGIPKENVAAADFIEAARVRPGGEFVTRPAPGVGGNKGGAIEVVVPPGGVDMLWFSRIR